MSTVALMLRCRTGLVRVDFRYNVHVDSVPATLATLAALAALGALGRFCRLLDSLGRSSRLLDVLAALTRRSRLLASLGRRIRRLAVLASLTRRICCAVPDLPYCLVGPCVGINESGTQFFTWQKLVRRTPDHRSALCAYG